MTATILAIIFITMIALLYYAAGMKDGALFLTTLVVGIGLMSTIVIEREIRAARLAEKAE